MAVPSAGVAVPATLTLRVSAIRYAAHETVLLDLERADGEPLPACEPGAHVTLHLPNGLVRQYSLVEHGAAPHRYVVGVKRDAASRGGSRYIHDQLRVGTMLPVEPPRNNFPLDEAAPHTVLVAGGIGITPLYCMARRLRALGRPFELHYAVRTRDDVAFARELAGWPELRLHVDAEAGRVLHVAAVVAAAPANAALYCCGPGPMLAAFEAATATLPPAQVHVEYFTPKQAAANSGGFSVELARSGRTIEVKTGTSLLEALRTAGVTVQSSCESGVCGACETKVLEGVPDHRDSILSEAERASNRTMMICCSGARSDRLVLDL